MPDDHSESAAAAAAAWFARLHASEADARDDAALQEWIREDAANAAAWDGIEETNRALSAIKDDPAIMALRAQALASPAPTSRRTWLRYAAAVALTIGGAGAAIMGYQSMRATDSGGAPSAVRYATAAGEVRTFHLADGSDMTLDGASQASVAVTADSRRISVDRGRAMFAVAKDKAHAFVVRGQDVAVTATGTHFSVERQTDGIVVALTEGSVRVVSPAGTRVLVPGQVLHATGDALTLSKGAADESAWSDGRLVFHDRPLGEVVATLNRYGGRQLVVADPALARRPFSGTLLTRGGSDALVAALLATHAARVSARGAGSVTLSAR